MPTICMFQGIIVRMYAGRDEHGPPHIHTLYQGREASFRIADCK